MSLTGDDEVADILGVSAIIVNDLKQKRKKDYNFSWESALQVSVFNFSLIQLTQFGLRY